MKHYLLLFLSVLFLFKNAQAQYVLTDSIDLGEDRFSHNYVEFNPSGGGTIGIGPYNCNGNLAITIGGNNEGDSIIFYLNVTPNVNEIMVSWNMSWFNAGDNKDMYPKLVIENKIEDELYGSGQNKIGSDPINCNMSLHKLVFKDVTKYTGDGKIKVKIFDSFPGFTGNASICMFKVYSVSSSGINKHYSFKDVKVFPNPFTNSLVLESSEINTAEISVQLFDMLGKEYSLELSENNLNLIINPYNLTKGIYILKISNKITGEILWHHKVNKE